MDDVLDSFDLCEVKGLLSDGSVILDLHDLSVLLENNTEVILDRCEALICHFDYSIREEVHHVLVNLRFELVRSLIEEGALDLRAIHVYQLNFEERSTVPGLAFLALRGDPGLDLPIP